MFKPALVCEYAPRRSRQQPTPLLPGASLLDILVLLLVTPGWVVCRAATYEVEGTAQETYRKIEGYPNPDRAYAFTVSVAGSNWFIKLVQTSSVPAVPPGMTWFTGKPDYVAAASDGPWFYEVRSYESHVRANPEQANAGEALRGPGCVPFSTDETILALWYAFASANSFPPGKNGFLDPMERLPQSAYYGNRERVPAAWRLDDLEPHLPAFIVTSNYCARSGPATGRAPSEIRFMRRSEQDEMRPNTNVVLVASDHTNCSGLHLPTRVDFHYFNCGSTGQFSCLPRKRLTVVAQSTKSRCLTTNFVPTIPSPSFVTDLRFYTSNPPRSVMRLTNQWPNH